MVSGTEREHRDEHWTSIIPPAPGRRACGVAAITAMLMLAGRADAGSYRIVTESVKTYGTANNLPNAPTNGACFMQGMTGWDNGCANSPSTSPWTRYHQWEENNVYDSDFVDSDLQPGGADQFAADQTTNAITYFTGHGSCSGCEGGLPCTSTSTCTQPNNGSFYWQKLPGTCRNAPGMAATCCYDTDRALYTNSTNDAFGSRAVYSALWASRAVAWGESMNGGAWSGAGTNGGVNLAVLDLSCGVLTPFWVQQLQPAFAGLQFLATIMPVNGDTAIVPDRGAAFARRWQVNAAEPIANAWTYTLTDLSASEGLACGGSSAYGGGHGINGCGCNFIISFDTQPRAFNKMAYGTWNSLPDDANDGIASSYYYWFAICNYDANAYPWQLP